MFKHRLSVIGLMDDVFKSWERRPLLYIAVIVAVMIASILHPPQPAMSQEKPFQGQTVSVLVFSGGRNGGISGPLYHWRDKWEQMTGAKLQIAEFPFGQLHEKMFLDLITGAGKFDIFMICASEMGELVTGDYIVPIDLYYDDPRFPQWPKDAPPACQVLHQWGNQWYGVLNDLDGQVLYYRKDILSNKKYMAQFADQYGYAPPIPPTTMEQLYDLSEFFNNWDWNGDGDLDSGIALPLKVGGQSAGNFMAISAPFVVLPGQKVDNVHNTYWFDFKSMKSIINEPGHLRALEFMIKLARTGPDAQVGWDLGEAWDYFLRGKAVFTHSWGDVGSLAQDPKRSKIKGKLGVSSIPGTMQTYDREQNRFIDFKEPHFVGNTTGCSWHGVISKLSKHPEAAYHLLAFHATKKISQWNARLGWTGVDIGRTNQLLKPWGPQTIEDYVTEGDWHPDDIVQYVTAYKNNFNATTMFPYLRIPGAPRYFNALDIHLSEAISGIISPQEAMDRTAQDFEEITDQLGRMDQLRYYRQAMNYDP